MFLSLLRSFGGPFWLIHGLRLEIALSPVGRGILTPQEFALMVEMFRPWLSLAIAKLNPRST